MLEISFHPESDIKREFVISAASYQKIWDSDKNKILSAFKEITSLDFKEKQINALVFDEPSRSYPMSLRAFRDEQKMRSELTHELSHRLASGNKLKPASDDADRRLRNHKTIYLFLYDVWTLLYGKKAADSFLERECNFKDSIFKEAWGWALSMNNSERRMVLSRLIP